MTATPKQMYEIRLSGHAVSEVEHIDPQLAVLDYLRSLGFEEEDIIRVGNDAASWRGALYTAVPRASEADA